MSSSYPTRFPVVPPRLLNDVDYNTFWDWVSGSAISPASYIIYSGSDGLYWARNGHTGLINYSGSDAATVIQNAINALPNGGRIFIKEGTYTINSRIVVASGVEICGVWGRTKLISAGITDGTAIFQGTVAITDLSIHDLYIEGKHYNPFPTLRVPTTDSWCILLTGGLAENIHIYNIWAKNFATAVFINGGGAVGNSRNWDLHNLLCEQMESGICLIRSQCTLVYNINIHDCILDQFEEGFEIAATNGGVTSLGGEIYGVNISNIHLFRGRTGGFGLNSTETVSTLGNKLHGINISNVTVQHSPIGLGSTGLAVLVSGAGGNAIYDFNIINFHSKDADTGMKFVGLGPGQSAGGRVSNFRLEGVGVRGIDIQNCPLPTYNPLHLDNGSITLLSGALHGIRLLQNLQNVTGIRFNKVGIAGSAGQTAIEHITGGAFSVSDIDYRQVEFAPGTMTVNISGSDVTAHDWES